MSKKSEIRAVIFGNSGSGKTTMAAALAAEHSIPHLDLDTLAWSAEAVRRDAVESAAALAGFLRSNPTWVIEGCYAGLIEQVLPHATEVRFLNPGVEACIANCLARPWEPAKYSSREAQDARLAFLLDWVRTYERRADEYSLAAHRRLFDGFRGAKREIGEMPAPRSI